MRRPAHLTVSLLTVASLAAVGCGVPISAEEITATAVGQGPDTATLDADPEAAPRSLDPLPGDALIVMPTPPPAAVAASSAATATPTPTATATPTPTETTTPASSTTPAATSTATLVPGGVTASEALRILNETRVSSGRPPLTDSAVLSAMAEDYARYMATQDFFGHEGLDGSTAQSRFNASDYEGQFKGEALAAGQASSQSAISSWLNSPAHAAIVLDHTAVDVGIGYAYTGHSYHGHYWVLVTGNP